MKHFLMACAFVLAAIAAGAQSFPQQFTGHWKGQLQWYRQGNPTPQLVTMQLLVQPADTTGHFTWQLIYGDGNSDNRPYILKPVDSARGHWAIDERNSIVIDSYWIGNQFSSAFSVGGTTIVNNYSLQGDSLLVEFRSFASAPLSVTGGTDKDIPPVESYNIRSYQKAILQKVNVEKR
ncbi:MAG: hypothetical protein ACO1NX_02830 [Chitinophagaceae bacterium]